MGIRPAKLLEKLKSFLISASITKTIKTSHIVIITFLLLPLMLSVAVIVLNTLSYNQLITNVDRTNRMNQVVKTEITNELWDIVAGNKSFSEGSQLDIINNINAELADIQRTTKDSENRQMLEVVGRAMHTLSRYVNRLGAQMERKYPVIENERMLDEIRGVTTLVSELLQDFIVREIEWAAEENQRITTRAIVMGAAELAVIAFAVLIAAFVRLQVAKSVDRSIGQLVALSSSIAKGDLDARAEIPHVRELEGLTDNLNIMADKIKTLIDENIHKQQNLQKAEMKALQAQIRPHFLYNTLDSIVWLAEGNQSEQVISITRAFSDFFRISLNRGSEWVRVRDEFKHIESYLTIQKIRYRDILDYSVELADGIEENIMLKLLLQPLVENALYHGIKNKRGRGNINVSGRREDGFLCFTVADNGIGMSAGQLALVREQFVKPSGFEQPETEKQVYGLYNVARRLELYYNMTGLMDIQSVYKEGTKVTFRVPLESCHV